MSDEERMDEEQDVEAHKIPVPTSPQKIPVPTSPEAQADDEGDEPDVEAHQIPRPT
jgi:hypothetical protein